MSEHNQRAHAELGASSAHRWMRCAGSIALSRGMPDIETEYSKEGTAAHELAQKCLHTNADAATFTGAMFNGVAVDDDMAEGVQVYLDAVRKRAVGGTLYIERRFDLNKLNPPAGMFGTADAVIVNKGRLIVVDLKYGKGHVVEVEDNEQLWYYGLGAMLSLPHKVAVDTIELVVVQPRASHVDGLVRSSEANVEDMLAFAGDLLTAARATTEPNAPLHAGPHCKFCKALARCPEQAKSAMALAQVEFGATAVKTVTPPDPRLMSLEQLSMLLPHLKRLEEWTKSVRAVAQENVARDPGSIPGWKLVQKRANRAWTDDREVVTYLQEHGCAPEEYETRKLRSPAQVEKVIGKKNLPNHLIEKKSSGYTLAPESDARPAVTLHPGDDFAALAAPTRDYEDED